MLSLQILRTLIATLRPSPLRARLSSIIGRAAELPPERLRVRRLYPVLRAFLLIIVPVAAILLIFPMLIVVFLSTLTFAPIVMPLIYTVFGMIMAANIAGNIAAEHERKTYDLLSTIPGGRFGLHLTYAHLWIKLHRMVFWFLVPFVVIGLVGIAFGMGFDRLFPLHLDEALTFSVLVQRLLLMLAFAADAFYSFVAAAVIGILAPAFWETRTNATFGAVSAYALVQITAYGVLFTLGRVLLPLLTGVLPPALLEIGIVLIMVLVFLSIREFVIVVAWRALRESLNEGAAELDPAETNSF